MADPAATATPCVDVIIAAWNRADTIERAVQSTASEPCVRRVYVIDDASTDDTAARAAAVPAPPGRVEVFRMAQNGGPSAARNLALRHSTAPWVAMLDGDDLMLPGRLKHLVARSDGWDMVADDILQVPEGSPLHAGRRLLAVDATWPEQVTLAQFVLGNIHDPARMRREMGFLKPIMRRSFLDARGLAYDPALRLGEDYILYATALAAGARFRILEQPGYVSMMRGNSLSAKHSRADLEALLHADRTLARHPGLSRAERTALHRHAGDIERKIAWLRTIEAVKARRPATLLATLAAAPHAIPHVASLLMQQARQRLVSTSKIAQSSPPQKRSPEATAAAGPTRPATHPQPG
jgi:succinoglycan biosynthesis protein ExoU